MRASRRLGLVLVAVAALAACGSTVNMGSGASDPGIDGTTAAGPGQQPGRAAEGNAQSPVTAPGSGTGPQHVPARGSSSGSQGQSSAPVARGPAAGGVTQSTISIGVLTVNAANTYFNSAGVKGLQTGDQEAIARAIVNRINAQGGLAGRRVVPVFYDINLPRFVSDQPTEAQAACTHFTQDHKVFAVVTLVAWGAEDFYRCLDAAGAVVVNTGELTTRSFLRRLAASLYQPSDMNFSRMLSNTVDALHAAKWFGSAPKIGVSAIDTALSRESVTDGLRPALVRHGLSLTAEHYGSSADYSAAVLRLKTAGVTHVFFAQGTSVVLFAQAARSQNYYPKYEVDSRQTPGQLVQANVPADQLRGAMGAGWMPTGDLDNQRWPAAQTPGRSRCFDVVRPTGENLSDGTTALTAVWMCDQWFFLRDVLARAQTLTRNAFRSSAEQLSGVFAPAATFRSRLSVGQLHDGASAYRLLAFQDTCGCFQYASGVLAAS